MFASLHSTNILDKNRRGMGETSSALPTTAKKKKPSVSCLYIWRGREGVSCFLHLPHIFFHLQYRFNFKCSRFLRQQSSHPLSSLPWKWICYESASMITQGPLYFTNTLAACWFWLRTNNFWYDPRTHEISKFGLKGLTFLIKWVELWLICIVLYPYIDTTRTWHSTFRSDNIFETAPKLNMKLAG